MGKKLFIGMVMWVCMINLSYAQRFGYVYMDSITQKMPEYAEANKELKKAVADWEKEINTVQEELNKMTVKLESEKLLLSKGMLIEREDEILRKTNELREMQAKFFGHNGLAIKRRQDLMRPIQDKVFEAVRRVAKKNKLNFIFDKAGDLHFVYSDPTYDYTDYVLDELGVSY